RPGKFDHRIFRSLDFGGIGRALDGGLPQPAWHGNFWILPHSPGRDRRRIIVAWLSRPRRTDCPSMSNEHISPDLQASVLCEDVRQEINGMQTLVGVLNVVPAPVVPIGVIKLCLWSRWCSGLGDFTQYSRIVGPDDRSVVAESEVR